MMKSLRSVLVVCFAAMFGAFIALQAIGGQNEGATDVAAAEPTAAASVAEVDAKEREQRLSEPVSLIGEPGAEDIVTVLVGLQGKPLLETANERGVSAADLLAGFDGEKLLGNLNAEISRAVSSLRGSLIDVGYRYTAVFNGFSAEVRYGDVAKLEKNELVSKVILSNEYEAPQEIVENDVNVQDTGIFDSTDVEFDGTGTVVAVLDTGTDYTHEVFDMQLDPDTMALTKDDIASVAPGLTATSWMGDLDEEIDEDDLYISSKLPYAFDYADIDTNVYPAEAHGTHVAGIIAGESWKIRGVAPRAQIATFKVFKDSGTSSTEGILAALNDAAVLGVDAINMSLGASCGFSREVDEENVNETYDLIEQSGISLVVAAGNEFSSSYGGANGNTNLASNPDSGTVGSPASYDASLAVASISGVKTPYMYVNGEREVYFNESRTTGKTEPNKFVDELLGSASSGEYSYVVIPGVGFEANYTNIDVNGKIAVVKRGNNSFEDKVKIAKSKGAVGVIIYNHLSGMLNMTIGTKNIIPSCLVSMDFGKYFEANPTGTIRVDKSYLAGPFVSDFSSWGPLPNLTLSPDITGHGGDITSSFPGRNEYDTISGTSMACPNIAGALVLVREYVKTLEGMDTTTEVRDLSYGLMMSTATIARNEDGNPYSPRKQGAGIGDIYRSVHTKAYLSVDGSNKPKLSLKDDPSRAGVYELHFNVTNMSTEALSYKINPIVMTESMSSDGKTVAEKAYMLSPAATYTVDSATGGKAEINGATLSIEGFTTAKVTVTVKLSAEDKAYLNKNFINGMYVEGYVELQSYNADKINLNLPFLAFYGNWEDAPMLDVSAYEVGESAVDSSVLEEDKLVADVYGTLPMAGFNMTDDYGNPEIGSWGLGAYGYNIAQGYETPVTRERYASLTHNSEGNYLLYSVSAGLLRGAKKVEMEIRDSVTGELIWSGTEYNARKSHSSGGEQMGGYLEVKFDVRDYDLANNGKYTFNMTCYLDWKGEDEEDYTRGNRNTFSFEFTIDDEKPVLLKEEDGDYEVYVRDANHRKTVEFNVHDNHYLQGYLVYTYEKMENGEPTGLTPITDSVIPIYDGEFNGTTRVSLDVTSYWDLIEKNGRKLYVRFMDYAKNEDEFYVTLKECDDVRLDKTRNARDQYSVRPNGTLDLEEYVRIYSKVGGSEFEGYWTKDLVWESKSPDIATVEKGGLVVGRKEGDAVITVHPDTEGGENSTLEFNVRVEGTPTTLSVRELELSNYSVSIERGEEITIKATVKPAGIPLDDLDIQWTSSSANITATRDPADKLSCTIKGLKSGSATIGVRIAGTYINASCSVRVKEEYYVDSVYLRSYTGRGDEDGVVEIPNDLGISYIYPLAFYQNPYIKKIILPEGVQYIMRAGIYGCDNLEEIVLPESCTQIQTFGVAWNPKLKKINTEHLQTIGAYAFVYDTSLESIDLSRTTYISAMAFVNCTSLKSVDLSKVGVIGEQAFYRCTALTDLVIPANTVTEFGAFYGCTSLKNVVCYGNHIGPLTFQNCTALTDVTFAGDVELIDVQAFYRCTSLTHVNFLGSVYEIGAMAFSYDTSLTSFTFPAGLTKLGQQVFYGSNITAITVDKDACIIEPDIRAFGGLSRLTAFRVEEGNKYLTTQDGVLYDKQMYRLIAYPFAKTSTTFMVPDSVRVIGANAFTDISGTRVATIDLNQVERIEARAFQQCGAKITGTDDITYIGDYAFVANDAVTAVPKNAAYIGDYAFAGCTNLNETFSVPAGVTHIGEYAFAECGFTSVDLSKAASLKEIGDGVFYACTSLANVTLGSSLEEISPEMFSECSALESITIPANIKKLGERAFYQATSLANVTMQGTSIDAIPDYCFYRTQIGSLTLPASVRTIGAHAFESTPIRTFAFNTITEIGDSAFEGTTSLNAVSNAINLNSIGARAFYNSAIQTVTSPTATKVGDYAFARCTSLTKATLGEAKRIGNSAFDGCTALATLNVNAAENIGAAAFRRTNALTSLLLPAAETIGANAFNGSSVSSLTLNNLRSVAQQAFAGAKKLTAITVAAYNTRFLTEDGVLYQKNGGDLYTLVAYPLNKAGTTYNVKKRTTKIGAYAFYENTKLTTITLPEHIKSIGVGAFYKATSLTKVEIGAVAAPTLESIGTLKDGDLINTYNNFREELGKEFTFEWVVPKNATGYDGYIWKEYLGGVRDATTNPDGKITKTETNAINASALDFIDRVNALSSLSGEERTAEINLLRRIYNLLDSTQQEFVRGKYDNTDYYQKLQSASAVSYVETAPLAAAPEEEAQGNGLWIALAVLAVAACGMAVVIIRLETGKRRK